MRYSPPTLALEYTDLRHPTRRRSRVRCFALEGLNGSPSSVAIETLARQLARTHPQYLAEALIPQQQLVRLLKKVAARGNDSGSGGRLQSLSSRPSYAAAHDAAYSADEYSQSAFEDSLETSHTSATGTAGSTAFGGAGGAGSSLRGAQPQHHDEEEEIDEEVNEEVAEEDEEVDIDADDDDPAPPPPPRVSAPEADASASVDPDDLDGLYHPPPAGSEDLNRVSDEELARKKAEMDTLFHANTLRPGDAGYVYDKQIDFEPTEDSEWD